jgi:hypothetical protein
MEHVSLFEALAYQEHEANWLTDKAQDIWQTMDDKGVDFDARRHMKIHPNGCPAKETCPICSVALNLNNGELAPEGDFDRDTWESWRQRQLGQ